MWEFLRVWSILIACVAIPGVVWLKYRNRAALKDPDDSDEAAAARELAEQNYASAQKRRMSQLLAEKLPVKTQISSCGVKFEAFYDGERDSVWVSNLGASPYLPAEVFHIASELIAKHARTPKGDATRYKLGEDGLPLDSIEGAVAHQVFGRSPGEFVYRRISAISGILVFCRLAEDDCKSGFLEAPSMKITQTIGAGVFVERSAGNATFGE